jgi:hypothetical protein
LLWFPAVVMVSAVVDVPAVAIVPTVVNIPSTGVSTSSGVLLLSAFPDVQVLSSAGVDPAAFVVHTAVELSGILDTIFAVAAVPYPVDILSTVSLSNVSGVSAVANLSAVGEPTVLGAPDIPAPSCVAFGSIVVVVLSTVDIEFLL